jgi:hypothetical protein
MIEADEIDGPQPYNPLGDLVDETSQLGNSTISNAKIGLTRWNPDNMGCRSFEDVGRLGGAFRTARAGAAFAFLFSCGALALLFIECTLCRLPASRFCTIALLVLAMISQSLTSVAYAAKFCTQDSSNGPYNCGYDTGTTLTIFATGLFLLGALMTCPTPTSKPLIRVLMDNQNKRELDDCCYCFRTKSETGEDEEGGLIAETPIKTSSGKSQDPKSASKSQDATGGTAESYSSEVAPPATFASLLDKRRVIIEEEKFVDYLEDQEERDVYMQALQFQKDEIMEQLESMYYKPPPPPTVADTAVGESHVSTFQHLFGKHSAAETAAETAIVEGNESATSSTSTPGGNADNVAAPTDAAVAEISEAETTLLSSSTMPGGDADNVAAAADTAAAVVEGTESAATTTTTTATLLSSTSNPDGGAGNE